MIDPKTSSPTAGGEAPKPMAFAIMGNAHEALRASIRLQEEKLDAGDAAAFREEWQTFQRALAVHMAMEDDAMFELLDEVDGGAITAAKLPTEHVEDARLAAAVDAVLGRSEAGVLRAAWSAWKESHLHHLEHEEEVMMPLTMKTSCGFTCTESHRRASRSLRLLDAGEWRVIDRWLSYTFPTFPAREAGIPADIASQAD